MKFAKHWYKKEVVADANSLGLERVTIWGASNQSVEEAERHASQRVEKFQAALKADFSRRDEYEYWLGFVREEVLEELKDADDNLVAVVSRNNYGAKVLNSQSMLIGDIDVPELGLFSRILQILGRQRRDKQYFLAKIERYQQLNPDYTFKVYETHSGLRFIIINQLFSAGDQIVDTIFDALEVDTLYRRLCTAQNCFRARLTPKPWRLGLNRPASRYPRSNIEQREFEQWLRSYQSASVQVSIVNEITTVGYGAVHNDIKRALALHDQSTLGISKPLA